MQHTRSTIVRRLAVLVRCVWPGSVAGPEKLQPLLDKNQEMFNAFVKAVEELAVLRNNLNKTEVYSRHHHHHHQ